MTTNRFVVLVFVALICDASARHAAADSFGSDANAFSIDFVPIGNPGNGADSTGSPDPAGAVPYFYRMGKYEVSEQMIDKANALGGLGITKDTRGADKPATSVSWNEAARFVNWLNTSTGSPPAYKFAIQPGNDGYSANADIELWAPSDPGYNANNLFRNSLARYFLPSVDEWYKAAYYNPNSEEYYDYPTGSDSIPNGIDFVGDTTFDAVYYAGGMNPEPNDITDVGVLSPYGTAGQGGNVLEWEETEFFDLVNDSSSSDRAVRGGAWNSDHDILLSSVRANHLAPSLDDISNVGFRVASAIPEPSTAVLVGFALVAGSCFRRRS